MKSHDLNDQYVLNGSNESLMAITHNQAFSLVNDIWQLNMIQRVLLSSYEGIYECKLVNSPLVEPYAFIRPAKM